MKRTLSLLMILFALSSANGQSEWKNATLTLANGSTINGQVEDKDWRTGPFKIRFRPNKDAAVTNYTPQEVRQFEVAGRQYFAASPKVVTNQSNVKTTDAAAKKYRTDEVFLLRLFGGEKELYTYLDQNEKEHFLIGRWPDELIPLDNYVYLQGSEMKREVTYRREVGNYLVGCQEITPQIGQLPYEQKAFIEIFSAWYDCQIDIAPAYRFTPPKPKFVFTPIVGGSFSILSYSNESPPVLEQTWTNSSSPVFGLAIQLARSKQNYGNRWELQLLYQSFDFSGDVLTDRTTNITINDSIEYKGSGLQLIIGHQKHIGFGSGKAYYGIGAGASLLLRNDFSNVQIRRTGALGFPDTRTVKRDVGEDTRVVPSLFLEGGFFLGSNISLGLRYQYQVNLQPNDATFFINTHALMLLGRYYFD